MDKEVCANFIFLTFDFIELNFQPLQVAVATYGSRLVWISIHARFHICDNGTVSEFLTFISGKIGSVKY